MGCSCSCSWVYNSVAPLDARSYPLGIELRLAAATVARQRARFTHSIRPLEDPVLPRREPAEDLRFHGFRPGEAQIGLEPRQAVGRKARTLFQEDADLVLPVDVV